MWGLASSADSTRLLVELLSLLEWMAMYRLSSAEPTIA